MRLLAFLASVAAFLLTGCAWLELDEHERESIDTLLIDTDQAVGQLLAGQELDDVEGAWEHDGHAFEIVISKNRFDVADGFDYVGIMTRTDHPSWRPGEIKLMLRRTDEPDVFEGVWLTGNRARRTMTFVKENSDLIQAGFVSKDGHGYFVRIRRLTPRLAAIR